MISTTKPEAVSLSKPDNPRTLTYTRIRPGHKEYKSNQKLNSGSGSRSPFAVKFQKAFKSALIARSAHLGRRLTRNEWVALKKAVHHQCTCGGTDKLSRKLNEIQRQVNTVEKLIPVDISSAFNSLELFKMQMDVLRRQMFYALAEGDTLSETCSHFRHRRLFQLPSCPTPLYFVPEGFSRSIHPLPLDGKLLQLCCPSCLEKRSDAFFEWTGSSITMLDAENASEIFVRKDFDSLKTVSPLSIQSVWTSLLSTK